MRCDVGVFDGKRCQTESEPPSRKQPDLLAFVLEGWFIAKVHGDICPACLEDGVKPKREPHRLMQFA
jgi:hypothetical protein